jgi:reductive dehalogenase
MKAHNLAPLPRLEDHVRRPSFIPVNPGERFKQTDQVFLQAMRGELGEDLRKINITTPPPHPMDRTVFSPTMVRALLWKGCEAQVFKSQVPVSDKKKMTSHIKQVAKEFGADLVGISNLHPAFVFENDRDGNSIELTHKYAIVMAKEMNYERIATSPSWYDHFEVGKTYQDITVLGVHLANYIGQLGYPARASVVGNDTVLHVPLAVYAGLGEYSRMGRLITKKYGPRVRLCTVTTDLPLKADHPIDLNIEHFCQICEKCAINCPAQSIQYGNEKVEIRGFLKWNENAEDCYRFWRKNPREWQACTRCIAVCPWNKPDNLLHKLVSAMVVKYTWTHKLVLFLDDLIYGRKPRPKKQPANYNDYLMKEEDYRRMLEETSDEDALLTKESMSGISS